MSNEQYVWAMMAPVWAICSRLVRYLTAGLSQPWRHATQLTVRHTLHKATVTVRVTSDPGC